MIDVTFISVTRIDVIFNHVEAAMSTAADEKASRDEARAGLGLLPDRGAPGPSGGFVWPAAPKLPADPWVSGAPQMPWAAPYPAWAKEQIERERKARQEEDLRRFERCVGGAAGQSRQREEAREAEKFALGVEEAQGPLGARHRLREALGAGHEVGLIRCWAAIEERGWSKDCLCEGRSETLMAAVFGRCAPQALKFLSRQGFVPGARLSSLALAAALAGATGPQGVGELVALFGAGSLDEANLARLDKIVAGLGAKARANGERFELGEAVRAEPSAQGAGPARL
jgi:hypothetical protein